VGAKVFHAVRRTDMKLTVALRNFVTAPYKIFWLLKCATKVIPQSLPSIGMTAITVKETSTSKLSKADLGENHELRGVSEK
jgi:hypothetical protein